MGDATGRPRRRPLGADGSKTGEWLNTSVTVAAIVTFYFVVPFGRDDDPLPLPVATTVAIVTALVLAALVARRIVRILDGATPGKLSGLLVLLVAVIVAFAMGYFLLTRSDPAQVTGLNTRLDALYFTLTTLATIGYGDIHPAGQAARAIAAFQVVFNVVFLAGLVRTTLDQARASRTGRDSRER
jgi:voltage-gated potassium channel